MVYQHSFRLWCVPTFMLHFPGSRLDAANLLFDLFTPRTSIPWISFGSTRNHLCMRRGGSDFISRKVVASADINSTLDLLNTLNNPSSVSVGCAYDLSCCNFEQFLRQTLIVVFLTSSWDALFVL
ncbi:UNVERIFIED_CONTAM: hypothetical protein NCL1_23172 [Trichonephila clavipes]